MAKTALQDVDVNGDLPSLPAERVGNQCAVPKVDPGLVAAERTAPCESRDCELRIKDTSVDVFGIGGL